MCVVENSDANAVVREDIHLSDDGFVDVGGLPKGELFLTWRFTVEAVVLETVTPPGGLRGNL